MAICVKILLLAGEGEITGARSVQRFHVPAIQPEAIRIDIPQSTHPADELRICIEDCDDTLLVRRVSLLDGGAVPVWSTNGDQFFPNTSYTGVRVIPLVPPGQGAIIMMTSDVCSVSMPVGAVWQPELAQGCVLEIVLQRLAARECIEILASRVTMSASETQYLKSQLDAALETVKAAQLLEAYRLLAERDGEICRLREALALAAQSHVSRDSDAPLICRTNRPAQDEQDERDGNLLSRLGAHELVYVEGEIRKALPDEPPAGSSETFDDWCGTNTGCMLCITPRSGSTYLATLLASTGSMGLAAEFMNPADFSQNITDIVDRLAELPCTEPHVSKSDIRDLQTYLKCAVRGSSAIGRVFGMKGDLYQFLPLFTRGWLRAGMRKVRFVYVKREDVLMQAISLYRAQQGGAWSTAHTPRSEVSFDARAILDRFDYLIGMMDRWETLFSLLAIQPLRLTYEQIGANPEAAVSRVFAWLGIEGGARVTSSPLRRQRDAESELWASWIRAEAESRLRGAAAYRASRSAALT